MSKARILVPALSLVVAFGLRAEPGSKPAPAAAKAPVAWTLDDKHSHIGFSVRHLGISNVKGEFKKFKATIMAGTDGRITQVEAIAETDSIDTGISGRDNHLKQDDFFSAAKFPELKLVTRSIQWTGDKFTAIVALTIRDKTRPIQFTGEFLGARKFDLGGGPQLRAGYSASAKINRKEFGLSFNKLAEGVSMVGDEVRIDLEIEMSRPM